VFSVGPTSAPMNWRDSEHVTCVFCALSVQRGYLEDIGRYNVFDPQLNFDHVTSQKKFDP
jgi:hypothetical protein